MTQPTPPGIARDTLYAVLMLDGIHGRGHTPDRSEKASELLDAYRDQVLTEAAALIRQHRGDLCDDVPWWDTRDRDHAARLLLAARTTTETVHACPPGNSALTPCCGKTPFELSRTDRLTYDRSEITCSAVHTTQEP